MSRELGGQQEINTGSRSCGFIFNMVGITVCFRICGIKSVKWEN